MLELTEAQIKRACQDYLEYQQNLGKLMFLRLNSGDFIEVRGDTRRRIQGCPKGTADFIVIRKWYPRGAPNKWETIVTFIEIKSPSGKTTKVQDEFAELVEKQGAEYYVSRSIEELEEILK